MEEKLITIIVLPYSQAQVLKTKLEENDIDCDLEELTLVEGTTSYSVKVKILEEQLKKAVPVLNEFLGKKELIVEEPVEKEDRHILVPVDFTPVSLKTSKLAINIASHLDIKLVFMHCYINPIIHSIPYSDVYVYDSTLLLQMDTAEKTANENFQDFITTLSESVGIERWKSIKTEFIIKAGYADEDILAYAHNNNSQLIVIGTGGDDKYSKVVGSVTADIIYNAHVPVLVVPEKSPVKEIEEFNRILYATNFDEKDFNAIDKLMNLLKPFDVKLICVHVARDDGQEWDEAKLEGMKEILKDRYEDKDFDCRLIIGEDIAEELEKFIAEEDIDILSLTTHKRNMISRLFNPSFARKMVFHTRTPLLVFHA